MPPKLKRRSSLGGATGRLNTSDVLNSTAATDIEDNEAAMAIDDIDEELERKARRGYHKRQSIGGTPAAVAASGTPGVSGVPGVSRTPGNLISNYSSTELAEHYANCMKLSAENKINVKNAFQLKLIDYMTEMLKKKKSNMDNFQAASCALDASTKIYAYRVDSVHNETMKLASGVGTTKNEQSKMEGGADMDMDGDDENPDQQTKKKKRRRKAATVEKNLNNINCPKLDQEFAIDPLFKKITAQFDSGSGGGQFLSTLRMRDDRCDLMLDSNATLDVMDEAPNPSKDEVIELDKDLLVGMGDDCQICPTFCTFSFLDWSLEKDEDLNSSQCQIQSQEDQADDEHAFDVDAAKNDDFNDVENDFFGGDDDVEIHENVDGPEEEKARRMPNSASSLADNLFEHLSLVPNEYSYFDASRFNAWAGPKHWKFKQSSKGLVRSGFPEEDKKKKPKRDKEKEIMAFDQVHNEDSITFTLLQSAMTLPKKAVKLQNKTIKNWGNDRSLFPEDMHYSGKDFVKLASINSMNVAPRGSKDAAAVDDSVADYDFDNANDTQNFCPDVEGETNSYPQTEDDNLAGFSNVFSQTQDQSDAMGLVSAPNRVEKVQIGYAKLAKKVDMRKLKSVEWSLLQESMNESQHNKENKSANETDRLSERSSNALSDGVEFKNLYKSLKVSHSLPSKMTESLSVPLAFVALLHLCNEQNLELTGTENLEELHIYKT